MTLNSDNSLYFQEFNGEAAVMFEHLNSEKHGWSYFHRLYGNDFIQDDYNYEGKFLGTCTVLPRLIYSNS